MSTQIDFDASVWKRHKEIKANSGLMIDIERLCIEAAGIQFEEIPEKAKLFNSIAEKVERLPEEIRPSENNADALYVWANIMTARLWPFQ